MGAYKIEICLMFIIGVTMLHVTYIYLSIYTNAKCINLYKYMEGKRPNWLKIYLNTPSICENFYIFAHKYNIHKLKYTLHIPT